MGSGLILLLIVGAWLAVLVPMALRAHDPGVARSAELLGDAVRVLARRSRRRRASRRVADARVDAPAAPRRTRRLAPVEPMLRALRRPQVRRARTAAQRRRLVLLTLLGAAFAALGGGLFSTWSLGAAVVLLAVTAGYVVHLRRLVVRRQDELWQQEQERWRDEVLQQARWEQEQSVPAAYAAQAGPYDQYGDDHGDPYGELLPDEAGEPLAEPYSEPHSEPYAVPQYEPYPVAPRHRPRAAAGETWTPVPVPPPLYLSAPAPRVRVVGSGRDATAPAEVWPDDDLELEARRAVGGW